MNLTKYRKTIDAERIKRRMVIANIGQEKKALVESKHQLHLYQDAQKVLQTLIQSIQASAHQQIAAVVTKCLRTVFDDPYTFAIEFEQKRGKTEARMVFTKGGTRVTKPSRSIGCGVIDVAAFALRLASILLSHPKKRRTLILDEPFRFLHSTKYRQRLQDLLLTLADKFQFQFILVSNIIEMGAVVRI